MNRTIVVVASALLVVLGACADSDPSTGPTSAPTTAVPASTTVATTTMTPTTTTAVTTTAATSTSSSTTAPAQSAGSFVEIWGPADGQWFNALPIPWVFGLSPEDPEEDALPGASGWITDEALVTVNGWPAVTSPVDQIPWRSRSGWEWNAPGLDEVEVKWAEGKNTVEFSAAFTDGTVATSTRTIFFDPTLVESTGWLVDLDRDNRTLTVAFAPYGTIDPQAGPWTGFLSEPTAVETLPLADDAAFVLLEPHSGGWPPPSALDYEEFVAVIDRAEAGECDACDTPGCAHPCYFGASPYGHSFFSPPDEFGDAFVILITPDNRIQQLEQIWSE